MSNTTEGNFSDASGTCFRLLATGVLGYFPIETYYETPDGRQFWGGIETKAPRMELLLPPGNSSALSTFGLVLFFENTRGFQPGNWKLSINVATAAESLVATLDVPSPLAATPPGCHDGALVRDGAIEHKWCALGGSTGLLGPVIIGERDVAPSFGTTGSYAAFQNGHIYFSPKYGAFETHGGPDSVYLAAGGPGGLLGLPEADGYGWNGGLRNDFEGGSIGWDGSQYSPIGKVWTFEVNPFEYEFFSDPANQLKLLLPTSAPVEIVDYILNSLAAIGLGTDVISAIQNPPPDQVTVNLWYSKWSERCLVEVVRLNQGRIIDSRVDSSDEVREGCSQSVA